MPLTRRVSFKRPLEKGNKVQVPKTIRWQFKMENDQVLYVQIGGLGRGWEYFYGKMSKDGRIHVPKEVLFAVSGTNESLAHNLVDISIEPAASNPS